MTVLMLITNERDKGRLLDSFDTEHLTSDPFSVEFGARTAGGLCLCKHGRTCGSTERMQCTNTTANGWALVTAVIRISPVLSQSNSPLEPREYGFVLSKTDGLELEHVLSNTSSDTRQPLNTICMSSIVRVSDKSFSTDILWHDTPLSLSLIHI